MGAIMKEKRYSWVTTTPSNWDGRSENLQNIHEHSGGERRYFIYCDNCGSWDIEVTEQDKPKFVFLNFGCLGRTFISVMLVGFIAFLVMMFLLATTASDKGIEGVPGSPFYLLLILLALLAITGIIWGVFGQKRRDYLNRRTLSDQIKASENALVTCHSCGLNWKGVGSHASPIRYKRGEDDIPKNIKPGVTINLGDPPPRLRRRRYLSTANQ